MTNRVIILAVALLISCSLGAPIFAQQVVPLPDPVAADIRVHPTGVNVNATGSTVVFLTYGGLDDYEPVEALWCAELEDAFPASGLRCRPDTIFGQQPIAFELGSASGQRGFTDIMTLPPSVARRAYQRAQRGARSDFFYVRRFESRSGAPDVFVPVTCRMAGGGARTPFALLDVALGFDSEAEVQSVRRGSTLPRLHATIAYSGTGQLQGRWEVVRPGDAPPSERDLLTEATLPVEERALQRRYTEVGQFSVFLPPSTGQPVVLPGPDPQDLPTDVEGLYQVLLRVEATDDKEGDSDLGAAGAGLGVVNSGGVAGFPLPPLRYFVGSSHSAPIPGAGALELLRPGHRITMAHDARVSFAWTASPAAAHYRLDVTDRSGGSVLSTTLPASQGQYVAPPWMRDRTDDGVFRWRIVALDAEGTIVDKTVWRTFRIRPE